MIPVSVSDIVKLLEQIPIWKALTGLPKRLTDLETRLAALEKQSTAPTLPTPSPIDSARVCPICDSTMKVTKEMSHGMFGPMGLKVHTMECPSCGNIVHRDYKPGKGYNV